MTRAAVGGKSSGSRREVPPERRPPKTEIPTSAARGGSREVRAAQATSGAGRGAEHSSPDARALKVALARLPALMRRALRLFRALTGFSAVTSLRGAVGDPRGADVIVPPVHPRCASLLRTTTQDVPCEEEWQKHFRNGLRSPAVQSHLCPLGLRCSCVPILFGENLVGIAKFVAGPKTTDRRLSLAVQALELAVSQVSREFYVSTLSEKLNGLLLQVSELQRVRGGTGYKEEGGVPAVATRSRRAPAAHARSLVEQALDYIDGHYLDSDLSLAAVSRALGVSDKYLTHLFTLVVGERMRAYIVGLRVQHACRQLLGTGNPVKQIAYESGFRQPDRFRHAFRRHVGVAPSTYRRIFAKA